nr:MAG TPA: hypothetical protein [Caudoviricetes sp.]
MLYRGTKLGAFYRGAYKPGKLYKGTQLVARYADVSKAAPASWDGTYDDVVGVAATGKGKQQTYSGRNLFDPSWLAGLAGWSQVGDVYSGPMSAANTVYGSGTSGFPIAFEDGKQYAIQYYTQAEAETQMAKFVVTYTDGTLAPLPLSTVSRQFVSLITAAGKTVAKLWFSYSADGAKTIAFDHVQVSQGTEITAYEPYVGGQPSPSPDYPQPLVAAEGALTASGWTGTSPTTVTLPVLRAIPGTDICDTLAYIGGDQWQVTRRVGVVQLTGTETWVVGGQYREDKMDWYYVSARLADAVDSSDAACACTHYRHGVIANNQTTQGVGIAWQAIRVRYGDPPDGTDAWKAFLAAQAAAGDPVTIWYALATPTTETVTLGELPSYPVHTELAVSGDYPPDVTGTVKVGN